MQKHDLYKINDPVTLPEEFSFRREKVWAQLDKKLQNRKRSWYAIPAAACVIVFTLLLTDNYINDGAPSAILVKEPAGKPNKLTPVVVNSNNVKKFVAGEQKANTHQAIKQVQKKNKTLKKSGVKEVPPAELQLETAINTIPQRSSTPIQEVTQPVVATSPTKSSRFKIAHVNELHPGVSKKERSTASIAHSEIYIPEVNHPLPQKQNGLFGLLRSNQ